MNSSNYKLSLDVQQACSPVVLEGKLGDTRRTLWISLTDGGVPYTIAGECYAVFTAAKPDGTFIANPCRILGNTIVYDLTPQTLAAAGYCDCEIRLYGADDGLLTSARFGLLVYEPTVGDEDVIQSETEVNALTQLIGDAAQAIRESELRNLESRVLIGELELHRGDFEQKAVDARADAKAAELSAQVAESSARDAGLARTAAELARQEAQLHRAAAEDAGGEAQLALQMAIQSQAGAEYWAGEAEKHAQEAAQNAAGGGVSVQVVDQRIEEAIREHSEIDDQCHPDIRKHLDALDQRFGDLEQLETEDKSSLVAAVNEVLGKAGTGGSGGNADQSGLSAELKNALKTYFTNMQTLITQLAFSTDTHIGGTLIANAMAIVSALENGGSSEEPDEPEQPESGIVQTGSILAITSGVTVNQIGAVLALA